ncbi:MAG: hypothetical protein EOM76_13175, partial [Sphingobacteriia bacterium]|nr:hypothetical protein [Sphingobacteriia bacterium]
MRIARLDGKKITYPDADAPLFGTQLYVKVEPDDEDPESPTPADGTDDQISIQIEDEAAVVYHSKWFGNACWFFFDVKINSIDISESQIQKLNLFINYNSRDLDVTLIRLGSWIGERIQRDFNGFTLFKVDAETQSSFKNRGVDSYCWFKMQKYGVVNITLALFNFDTVLDSVLGSFYFEYDIYYYCFTNSPTPPAEDFEGWLGGYEIKPICSTLGIEPQKSKFVWVDRYGFVHTYYFEVTSITNGKGDKLEYSKTAIDANDNVSYYKTSISQ